MLEAQILGALKSVRVWSKREAKFVVSYIEAALGILIHISSTPLCKCYDIE
jgi:hypothetical protein